MRLRTHAHGPLNRHSRECRRCSTSFQLEVGPFLSALRNLTAIPSKSRRRWRTELPINGSTRRPLIDLERCTSVLDLSWRFRELVKSRDDEGCSWSRGNVDHSIQPKATQPVGAALPDDAIGVRTARGVMLASFRAAATLESTSTRRSTTHGPCSGITNSQCGRTHTL